MSSSVIETRRIYLRAFNLTDAMCLYELNNDPEVMQYTGDKAFTSIDSARAFIYGYDHYQRYGYGRWVMIHKTTEEWLGWCGLKFHEHNKKVDLGFRLKKQYWGNGFASEAGQRCIDFGFNKLRLSSIIGRAAENNGRSINLLLRLGMIFTGTFPEGTMTWRHYEICSSSQAKS